MHSHKNNENKKRTRSDKIDPPHDSKKQKNISPQSRILTPEKFLRNKAIMLAENATFKITDVPPSIVGMVETDSQLYDASINSQDNHALTQPANKVDEDAATPPNSSPIQSSAQSRESKNDADAAPPEPLLTRSPARFFDSKHNTHTQASEVKQPEKNNLLTKF